MVGGPQLLSAFEFALAVCMADGGFYLNCDIVWLMMAFQLSCLKWSSKASRGV